MVKIICDRCKVDIAKNEEQSFITVKTNKTLKKKIHLCEKCGTRFVEFLNGQSVFCITSMNNLKE